MRTRPLPKSPIDGLEPLEPRLALSAIIDTEPNNDATTYQPINGDTAYTITGSVSTGFDSDQYRFYVEAGSQINLSAAFSQHGSPSLYDPNGQWRAGGYVAGQQSFDVTAQTSGVWILHVGGGDFWGLVSSYTLSLSGMALPELQVEDLPGDRLFYISAEPAMPEVRARLTGVVLDSMTTNTVSWESLVEYVAADFPANGVRGPGRDIDIVRYAEEAEGELAHTLSFEIDGEQMIRGGRLSIFASVQVRGVDLFASTSAQAAESILILGENPEREQVRSFIESFPVPAFWPDPSESGYDYHVILRKIAMEESGSRQFYQGVPLWSTDSARGVGVMQLTDPKPTDDQVWDWKANVAGGIKLFNEKFIDGRNRLDQLFDRINQEADGLGAEASPITGQMQVMQAIRGYNGYNNGGGAMNEWREVRDHNRRLVILNGRTLWERIPIKDRLRPGYRPGDRIPGVPDYVDRVLAQQV